MGAVLENIVTLVSWVAGLGVDKRSGRSHQLGGVALGKFHAVLIECMVGSSRCQVEEIMTDSGLPDKILTLLIIDSTSLPISITPERMKALLGTRSPGRVLHVLALVEDPSGKLREQVKGAWGGPIEFLSGKACLEAVADEARAELSNFVAELRHRLEKLAFEAGGTRWAKRFGELWWYTQVSEKNSPLDDVWWDCVRLEAVRRRMSEVYYASCVFIGRSRLMDLVHQLCDYQRIEFFGESIEKIETGWLRLLAKRMLSGMWLTMAVALARIRFAPAAIQNEFPPTQKRIIAYSWPEFWRWRFGVWQDVYFGPALDRVTAVPQLGPVCVLSVYGRAYIPARMVLAQFKGLSQPQWDLVRFVVLEAYGSVRSVMKEYLGVRDIIAFVRMTKSSGYRNAFTWRGVDMTKAFSRMMWESVLVMWPYLSSQERMATEVTQALRPSVVMYYSFEYLVGRALLRGTRRFNNVRIIAMQHGPMAPMKFTYAGTPDEIRPTPRGAPPWPEADIYAVDGPMGQELLMRRGVGRDRIRVTGAARLDPVWELAKNSPGQQHCARLPIRLLIAPGLHDTEFVTQFVLNAFSGDNRVTVTIKPHPKISSDQVRQIIESFTQRDGGPDPMVEVVGEGEIYEWFEQADILVGTYSSAAIEAILFGIPVVLLGSHRKADMSPFVGLRPPALTADDVDDLRGYVGRLIEDRPFREEYLLRLQAVARDVFGEADSHGADRLAALCQDQAIAIQSQPVVASS